MTEKTNSTGHLTFLDGVMMVNKLYQDGLSNITTVYENAPAAEDLEARLSEIDQDIVNKVLLNGYFQKRAQDLSEAFNLSDMSKW